MAKPPVPAKVSELLGRPNPAVIAAVRPDGQPVTVATWYLWERGRVLVNMDEGRRRLDYLRANPHVSLTVLKDDDWYSHISLQGYVVELTADQYLTDIDRISRHYTGVPYPVRERARVNAWIELLTWHAWGSAKADR